MEKNISSFSLTYSTTPPFPFPTPPPPSPLHLPLLLHLLLVLFLLLQPLHGTSNEACFNSTKEFLIFKVLLSIQSIFTRCVIHYIGLQFFPYIVTRNMLQPGAVNNCSQHSLSYFQYHICTESNI